MANIFKRLNLLTLLFFMFALVPFSYAEDKNEEKIEDEGEVIIIDFDDEKKNENRAFPRILIPSDGYEEDYYETPLRRFDIVFFLSIPFVFGYQFLLSQILSSSITLSGHQKSALSDHQWMYIGLSSILLAFGVSYHDYMEMKQKDQISEMSAPSAINHYYSNPQIQFAWTFSF